MTRRLPMLMFGALSLSLGAMAQDVQFQKDVLPILENSCFECHRTAHTDAGGRLRRPKGGVTMDTKAGIEAGKRGKPIVVAGKPDDSPMYALTQLPEDDEDHMPPKDKKPPLSRAQGETLKKWIEQGAKFGDWVGKPPAGAVQNGSGSDGPRNGPGREALPPDVAGRLAKDLKPADAAAISKAAGKVAKVEPIADGSPLLQVAFAGHEDQVDDAAVAALAPLADNITALYLGRTKVGDGALATIARMPRLVRLDLRETNITDQAGTQLAALPELRTLNLFGTKVGDATVGALAKSKNLERLFLYQTGASAAAVQKLQEALPKLQVVMTAELPAPEEGGNGGPQRRRRGQ